MEDDTGRRSDREARGTNDLNMANYSWEWRISSEEAETKVYNLRS